MRKQGSFVAKAGMLLSLFLLLSGCGGKDSWKEWKADQLEINKDGQVIYCVVDGFEKNIYDVDELTGMAVAEAAEFNGRNKTGDAAPVTVLDVSRLEEEQDKVRVVYRFDTGASYTAFQGETLVYETLEEAVTQKHVFSGSVLYNGEDSLTLDEPGRVKYRTKHVVVTDAKALIHLPEEVLYCSHGVTILKDGSVDTTGCEDTAVILLKK